MGQVPSVAVRTGGSTELVASKIKVPSSLSHSTARCCGLFQGLSKNGTDANHDLPREAREESELLLLE